eukprot:Colp12_sorted_trinity150504_noHs@15954
MECAIQPKPLSAFGLSMAPLDVYPPQYFMADNMDLSPFLNDAQDPLVETCMANDLTFDFKTPFSAVPLAHPPMFSAPAAPMFMPCKFEGVLPNGPSSFEDILVSLRNEQLGFDEKSDKSNTGSENSISNSIPIPTSPASSATTMHSTSDGSPSSFDEQDANMAEVRRAAHIQAEQKRRNNINLGFEELQEIIPALKKSPNSKFSKATVLRKAIDYINYLLKEKNNLVEEVAKVRKEISTLKMIINKYQQSGLNVESKSDQALGDTTQNVKFYLFCSVVDRLFESFNASVSLESPELFSQTLMQWFQDYCCPESLREMFLTSLKMLGSKMFTEDSAKRIRRWTGAISACRDSINSRLDYGTLRSVPGGQFIERQVGNVAGMLLGAKPGSV